MRKSANPDIQEIKMLNREISLLMQIYKISVSYYDLKWEIY